MQPQDPNSQAPQQTNVPTPEGGAAPTPPAPSAGPQSPWQQPGSAAPSDDAKKKKMMMVVVGVVVGLAIIAAAVFGGMKIFGSSLKLETVTTENFSMLVPVGYEKTEESGITQFKETGDEEGRSEVMGFYQKAPTALTDEEVTQTRDLLKEQLEGAAEELTDGDKKIEDLKIEDVKYKGKDAIQLTAKATKGGSHKGDIKLIAVITNDEIYMVGVGADASDPGVKKKMDAIIDSFEIK